MFVKSVPPRTLAVEVICATLGRAAGLPMPKPALVKLNPGIIPNTPEQVLFGSESVGNPDLKQWLHQDEASTLSSLIAWAKFIDAGCFDEWVANNDRHGGNILYGGKNNFALIDHSECLPEALRAQDPASANILLTLAAQGSTPKKLTSLYSSAKLKAQPFSAIQIESEIVTTLSDVTSQHTVDGLMSFLQMRTHSLMMLISNRLGCSQTSMVINP